MSKSLQKKYLAEVVPAMVRRFDFSNVMQVPKITKVVVNVGVGRIKDEKQLQEIIKMMTLITGQKPALMPAKKSVSAFKTRLGQIIGYKVTLRGKRMYDFIERLINVALPRERDFRGLDPKAFDRFGNLTIGIKEHIVFPEIIGEDYKFLFGFEITVVTNARKRERGIELLRLTGFPIKN